MLTNNMTLKAMIDFQPSAADMAMLPLDVVVWGKVSIVSLQKEDNHSFIIKLFTDEMVNTYLKEITKTLIYDFDGRQTRQERFVTIFEINGLLNYAQTSLYLQDILEAYTHEADVVIDLYTHDDKAYRLSNLDGIVKLEELTNRLL